VVEGEERGPETRAGDEGRRGWVFGKVWQNGCAMMITKAWVANR
jgi:hypothetical protein